MCSGRRREREEEKKRQTEETIVCRAMCRYEREHTETRREKNIVVKQKKDAKERKTFVYIYQGKRVRREDIYNKKQTQKIDVFFLHSICFDSSTIFCVLPASLSSLP